MNTTTKDIAIKCNVSKGTVDRALNNRPGVNAKTREAILKVAHEMGYHPHYLATSLVTGKTKSIGVVVFDLHNAFFAQLLNAISNKAKEFGYFVYITLTDKVPVQEIECIDHLVNGRVDGLIICPINTGDEYVEYLKRTNLPIVSVMNSLEESFFSYSGIDNYQAMYDATKYVISKGYNRIVYFSPPLSFDGMTNISGQKQRYLGHLSAIKAFRDTVDSIIISNKNYADVLSAVNIGSNSKAIVMCSSDIFALKVMNYFKLRGVNIPYDVGIMGFDNIDEIKYMEPSLSTVSIPIKEVGEQAVVQLIELINNSSASTKRHIIEFTIVAGQTVI